MFDFDACQRREAGLRDFSMMRANDERAPARRLTLEEIREVALAAMPKWRGVTVIYNDFDKPTANRVVLWWLA